MNLISGVIFAGIEQLVDDSEMQDLEKELSMLLSVDGRNYPFILLKLIRKLLLSVDGRNYPFILLKLIRKLRDGVPLPTIT